MGKDQLFESAFIHSSIGMALVGKDGTWLDVNPALCKILGYSKEEFLKLNIHDLTHSDDHCQSLKIIKDFTTGKAFSHVTEKRYRHRNGDVVCARLTVSAIYDEGEFKMFLSQIQDITQMKINEQKLLDASKMAALGEIAAGIAHEINNPLTAIEGNASILRLKMAKLGIDDLEVFNRLKKIRSTVQRISSIISGMRNLARTESSQKEDGSLKGILQEGLTLCGEKLSDIEVTIDIESDLEVNCNKVELGQVFINLVSNASHALEESQNKRINIRAQACTESVRVFITDTGKGIPNDIRNKVMKPFFTTKPVGKGTGLGLSLSKQMMERMGGDIELLESSQGTTFCVSVPKAKKEPQSAA